MGKQKSKGQERGAAEEQSDVPMTQTEMRANERPPSDPGARTETVDDASGVAGGASGSSGGGASTPGHPDSRS
ncbi:preprotein translocase YidC [Micromonospora sp. NPDC049559]|uniref:preprotein translocase YidC n=1 Tax=Micromonospora sp. NPDC049559 TaxID=3155923 RepID=UPI0034218D22